MAEIISAVDVATIIRQHIDARAPFSLIRLGDGEARLLGFPTFVTRNTLNDSLLYWYGRADMSDLYIRTLAHEIMKAVQNCDILGLPNKDRGKAEDGILFKMRPHLVGKEAQVAGCGVHRALYTEGLLTPLLQDLNRISLITCRDVTRGIARKFHVKHVRWITVPPEAQLAEIKPAQEHYPTRHYEVLLEIDPEPGEVFLVGAGPNGKVYCGKVKEKGGIAIDLGSVFDGWAGVRSRSYIAQSSELYRL